VYQPQEAHDGQIANEMNVEGVGQHEVKIDDYHVIVIRIILLEPEALSICH